MSREMINATRKVKEKAEPELREAVKRGRIGVQDAAKVADLPPDQQKAIAESPKPRRAANVAIEQAKNSAAAGEDPRVALGEAWEKATALRRLWKAADNGTREWFMEEVWFDLNKETTARAVALLYRRARPTIRPLASHKRPRPRHAGAPV